MNINEAIEKLDQGAAKLKVLREHAFITGGLEAVQALSLPDSVYFSPIDGMEPLWVAIERVEPNRIWFHYASVVEHGLPAENALGHRRPSLDIVIGEGPGKVHPLAAKDIALTWSLAISAGRLPYMQVVTTKQKRHTWLAAYHINEESARCDVFRQNKEKK